MTLKRRLTALEVGSVELSPAVKVWLGWPLSQAEQISLDAHREPDSIDTGTLSQEARTWLGMD